ncbi:proline-rich transmembrane protein 1-like [Patiria miniata]|uniref:Interferon-induced transmembrane protein n=1 Tax=Patiria miniata TaxID=46514 RepID=A0A913ZPU4_PATMI|nr:proline-rich transmembrane protein 1-like [Patiria miniata]
MDGQGIAPPPYDDVVSTPTAADPSAGFESKGDSPSQGGAYVPQGGAYSPQGGTNVPQGGYAQQVGTYAPQGGGYAPQGGAYAPQGVYTVQAGGYQQSGLTQMGCPQQIIRTAGNVPPPDYMMFALMVTLFCFLPLGLIGMMKAMEARNRWQVGDGVGAHQSAQEARRWSIAGLAIGIPIIIALVVILIILVI